MGASQRTRCRDRRACAAADHHRIGRQPGRNRRGRSGAFRNVGCVAGRASRLAGRQDRLRRLPDGQGARRQGLRQWRRCAQQGTVRSDTQGGHWICDALGRHRFAPRAAYRHHPFRRGPDAGAGCSAVGTRCQPARAAHRTGQRARASGAGLRLGRYGHLLQRDRRNHRAQQAQGSGGDRRASGFVGSGHRRHRRRRWRGDHDGCRPPDRPTQATTQAHHPRGGLRQRGAGSARRQGVCRRARQRCQGHGAASDWRGKRLRRRAHLCVQHRRGGAGRLARGDQADCRGAGTAGHRV